MGQSQPCSPGGTGPPEDPFLRRFLMRDPAALKEAVAVATRVVRFRGYYVSAGERTDVVQDVMLHLWQAVTREGFRAPTNFPAFIRTVAYRRCVHWMREQRRDPPPDPQAPRIGDPPDIPILQDERARLGLQVLQEVRAPCRELIRLRIGEGKSYRDIATLSGRSEHALRQQLSQCLKEAREALELLRKRGPSRSKGSSP